MKKLLFYLLILGCSAYGQTPYKTADVKALIAKYPIQKNALCANCYLWKNPFYISIADLKRHMPICEFAVVTKEHRVMQEALYANNKKIRSGTMAAWFVVPGDEDVRPVYGYENKQIGKPMSIYEVVYGHCGLCYVLAAWCPEGMVFSDVVDFNAGMEYQGQNIGSQIASEDTTRLLIGWDDPAHHKVNIVDSVRIWGGCYAGANAKTVTLNNKIVTIPDAYWKIIVFNGQTVCYWLPNLVTENRAVLPHRHIKYADLVAKLGFDPEKVIPTPTDLKP